jgi:hypothetical protein
MKRLMKVLLGLSIGAAVAMLFAPKTGRQLRERLIGGATGKLLPAAPVEFPEPEAERLWEAGAATVVAEPPVVEAVVEEVVAAEPTAAEEAPSEDLRARIEATRAAVESDITHPFAEVVAEEAVVEEAPAEEVVVEEVVAEDVALEESVVEEAAAESVDTEEAVVEESLVDEAVLDDSELPEPAALPTPEEVMEAPLVEPVVEPSEVAEPVVEQSPAGEPTDGLIADITSSPVAAVVAEAPVAEPPIVEDSAADDESAAQEGGTINQAEMRRRIEETRARLKAKAFDAMMSGESALLARDSGEKPIPKGTDVKLDGELESTIDESLSQEEY